MDENEVIVVEPEVENNDENYQLTEVDDSERNNMAVGVGVGAAIVVAGVGLYQLGKKVIIPAIRNGVAKVRNKKKADNVVETEVEDDKESEE